MHGTDNMHLYMFPSDFRVARQPTIYSLAGTVRSLNQFWTNVFHSDLNQSWTNPEPIWPDVLTRLLFFFVYRLNFGLIQDWFSIRSYPYVPIRSDFRSGEPILNQKCLQGHKTQSIFLASNTTGKNRAHVLVPVSQRYLDRMEVCNSYKLLASRIKHIDHWSHGESYHDSLLSYLQGELKVHSLNSVTMDKRRFKCLPKEGVP